MKKSTLKEFVSSSKKDTTQDGQLKVRHTAVRGLSTEDKGKILSIVSVVLVGSIVFYLTVMFAGQIFQCLLYILCMLAIVAVFVYVIKAPKESFGVIVLLLLSIVAVAYYNGTL
jgi:hypothetical protein